MVQVLLNSKVKTSYVSEIQHWKVTIQFDSQNIDYGLIISELLIQFSNSQVCLTEIMIYLERIHQQYHYT